MKKLLILLSLAVVATSCQKDPDLSQPSAGEMVEGTIYMKLDREMAEAMQVTRTRSGLIATGNISFDELSERYHVTDMERIFEDNGFPERTRRAGLDLWYKVTFEGNAKQVAEDFAQTNGVTDASVPNKIAPTYAKQPEFVSPAADLLSGRPITRDVPDTYKFNDPLFASQWPLYNDATQYLGNDGSVKAMVAGCDINVIPAWEQETGNSEVIVAVIDEGVQYSHPDLAPNMWKGNQYGGANFNQRDYDQVTWGSGHGTHVAGTIAAVTNNGIGISGIAGGSGAGDGVQIMTCEIFHPTNGQYNATEEGTANALKFACDNGAVIAQNSWGYTGQSFDYFTSDMAFAQYAPVMKDAIDYFIANAGMDDSGNQVGPMAGGVVIFSAGNGHPEGTPTARPAYPGSYTPCLNVGALSPNYRSANYANYGSTVDITAPGGGLSSRNSNLYEVMNLSTLPTNLQNGDTYYENGGSYTISNVLETGYGWNNGTSMSCPHVSGVAALVVSKLGGPGFTADQLKERLLTTGRNIDEYQTGVYKGAVGVLVDATAALNGTGSNPNAPTITPENGQSNEFSMGITEKRTLKFTLANYTDWNLDDPTNKIDDSISGNVVTLVIDGSKYTVGSYTATLMASDSEGAETNLEIKYSITDKGGLVINSVTSPFSTYIEINTNKSGNATMRLLTVAGVEVFKKTISLTSGADTRVEGMSKLSTGIYMLKLETGGKSKTVNIVKNN